MSRTEHRRKLLNKLQRDTSELIGYDRDLLVCYLLDSKKMTPIQIADLLGMTTANIYRIYKKRKNH